MSSAGVFGPIVGLALSLGLGNMMVIKNLSEPIRIVMPNKGKLPEPKSFDAYCELMRTVHLVECRENTSIIILKIRPWFNNFTGNLFVFMNKGMYILFSY